MRRVLALYDMHMRKRPGGEDKRTLAAIKDYASKTDFDVVLFGGDLMDNNSISHHNLRNLRAVEGETIFADYEHANKELDEWQQATPTADKVVLEGNHDNRVERLIDAQPQLKGLIETDVGLKLKQRGWKWVPYWSKGKVHKIGKAGFIHGRYICDHHAKKHVQYYGCNIFYGHTHDVQSYSMVLHGDDSTMVGQSLGCLCDYKQSYMQGAPSRWQQAFGEFWVQDNGNFNYSVVRIFNHRFVSPQGELFKP